MSAMNPLILKRIDENKCCICGKDPVKPKLRMLCIIPPEVAVKTLRFCGKCTPSVEELKTAGFGSVQMELLDPAEDPDNN